MRFSQRERVRYVVCRNFTSRRFTGKVVEIVAVGPFVRGDKVVVSDEEKPVNVVSNCDYIADFRNLTGHYACLQDWQLQKLHPPIEPVAMSRQQDVGQ